MSFWVIDNYREFFAGLIIYYLSFRFHDLVSSEFKIIWDTKLVTNKFLFSAIISVSMNLILEKLRTKLKLKVNKT